MANFSELDRYLFGQATHYEIYRKLGAHPTDEYGIRGVCFDLWAPNAARVWVIGSFNGWDEGANEMKRLEPETMGIFELFIPVSRRVICTSTSSRRRTESACTRRILMRTTRS
jgi:1,4-alpha-glucan branching enzyme